MTDTALFLGVAQGFVLLVGSVGLFLILREVYLAMREREIEMLSEWIRKKAGK